MTTDLTRTDYSSIQALIEKNLDGETKGFEVVYNDLLILVSYEVEYKEVQGGSYEGYDFELLSVIDNESFEIAEVWDEEGNEHPEIGAVLQVMFN